MGKMNQSMKATIAAVAGAAVLLASPATATADSILGIPTASLNSTTQVGLPLATHDATPNGVNDATSGWVKYYIPLRSSTSGTYGVNGRGMSADTGSGGGWLNMNLVFTPVVTAGLISASLLFEFSDLDLRYVNDPAGFLETVRIYGKDGSSVEAMTPNFTQSSGSGSTGVYNNINYQVTRQAGSAGASWPVLLNLWGDGLEDMISNPFWVQLRFTVPTGVPYGTNTAEYLRATLSTSNEPSHVVPEPASMLLLGAGLGAAAIRRRKQSRKTVAS
jgi:hypothetical protein